MELKALDWKIAQRFFVDFQKKSRCFELPHESSEYIGIYENEDLLGYFAVLLYKDKSLDIIHGYLKPEARHKQKIKSALTILETLAQKQGYTIIRCKASRSFNSYIKFMKSCGFRPTEIIFSKAV